MAVMSVAPMQLGAMFRDYRDSWTTRTGQAGRRARRAMAVYLYGLPTLAAAVFVVWHVELTIVVPFLTAMSVFTALLFGLLFLVFNLALTLRKDGNSIPNAHGLGEVVTDLRATITYTIFVAVALVGVLAVAASSIGNASPTAPAPSASANPSGVATTSQVDAIAAALPWPWTVALIWLGVHLILNLVKILERFRTAFNYISR